ncbi:TetR family transcriptional regulator [Caballeronia udeis]|uniref:TetR family transcriptional regulator n=1 Tax=Caballeronia udeis TaxID=1232866 RepID=A0A158HS87_9BURK|nr:TetR family transcriptional regulator [Caballeronia udeis]SAL47196.1 TetR family transcriptional regulator [Caballeronia udeis]
MDNPTRSERSRAAAIQAALTIVCRDGPGQLTFDAISRESGISKGGLMHQFQTKGNVLKALLEHRTEYFENFSRDYLAKIDPEEPSPTLLSQIATTRESMAQQNPVGHAILAALVEDPSLMTSIREADAKRIKRIKAEATDPDLALLRLEAARGLALSALLGLCPLSDKERGRLFDRLLDERQWPSSAEAPKKTRSVRASRSASARDQSA